MTSVTYARVSRPWRGATRRWTWAPAAALAGALALTGCGDDGGSDSDDSASGAPSTTASAATGGGSGSTASPSASGALEGSWIGTADGEAVVLMVTGGKAALYATGGTVCSGTAGDEAGMRMIHLTCTTGKKNRTTGMVDSVNDSSLQVTWEGGVGKESYTKAEDGKWPSGLPTV